MAYATKADIFKYGLPRGALGNPGRLAAGALAATSQVELAENGFSAGDPVTLRFSEGGNLPSPLLVGVTYYVQPLNDSFFQLSATPSGGPITFTTDGVSVIVTADLPFNDVLEFYSRFADGFMPSHAVPLPTPYPITVVAIVATLAAKRLQILSGLKSESMDQDEIAAGAQLKRWASGLPVRDANVPPNHRTNLAINTNRTDRTLGFIPDFQFDPLE